MKPAYLYIENFLCYDKTELDLSAVNSALIIGKNNNNDNVSNGVGKSTIFRAIEYVLFNEARNLNLEEVIRDDTNECRVVFDFILGDAIWRVSRRRTRKGTSDLSLFERIKYDEDNINPHTLNEKDAKFKLFWQDKSSRRTPDTEADLAKLIKTNYKAFANAFLFAQNDFNSGLANVTASKRRSFFRDSLPMGIYSKLEKLAKEAGTLMAKELDKKRAVRDAYPDLNLEESSLKDRKINATILLSSKADEINIKVLEVESLRNEASNINAQYSTLQAQLSSILDKKKAAEDRVKRLNNALNDAIQKRKAVAEQAKDLTVQIKELKANEVLLSEESAALESVDDSNLKINNLRDEIASLNAKMASLREEIRELEIPLPDDAVCKHCRQILTDAHRRACESEINKDIVFKKELLLSTLALGKEAVIRMKALEVSQKTAEAKTKELAAVKLSIISKQKEIQDKKALFDDYVKFVEKQKEELEVANQEFIIASTEVENSNEETVKNLKLALNNAVQALKSAENVLADLNKSYNSLNTEISVIEDNLKKNEQSKKQKEILVKEISELEEEYSIYPDIIQSFSSTGIPNQIIQSLLDDLQIEANNILSQIKPSLQLAFSVVKTTGKGTEDDDLDIKYFYNNKTRSFGAISGAMQLSVMFALKLGYAFLLHKTLGTDIKFLMLDEVDMPLDKASIDALADIIKFFQKDFTVMIISHNDRSKEKIEKFSNVVLVEQDQNMISRARIAS